MRAVVLVRVITKNGTEFQVGGGGNVSRKIRSLLRHHGHLGWVRGSFDTPPLPLPSLLSVVLPVVDVVGPVDVSLRLPRGVDLLARRPRGVVRVSLVRGSERP